jgi:hypothetical protein
MSIHPLTSVSSKCVVLTSDDTTGFLRKLASLVAQIYTTLSKISQSERTEIVNFELKYKANSFESADMTRTRGQLSLGVACISLAISAAAFGFTNLNDRKFVQITAEKAPEIARLFDTSREAGIKDRDALAGLEMTKLQDKNNKTQNDGNIKEQFAQVLQAEIQLLRSAAARSN